MPVINLKYVPFKTGSAYPGKLTDAVSGRSSQRLADAGGLTQFGANLVNLQPGGLSSLRHYHMQQDEFVMITQGTCTLIDDNGEHDMKPGDCAAFPAGDANGHHFVNNTDAPAAFLVIGTHSPQETAYYSDIDMMAKIDGNGFAFTCKDGSPLTADQIGE